MSAPLLHTRVRNTIETDLPPEQVAALLPDLMPEYACTVDASDSDTILFELTIPEITISGRIRRWQGTGSRLDYLGEVLVPETNLSLRRGSVIVALVTTSIIYWLVIINFIDDPRFPIDIQLGYISVWLGVLGIVGWGASATIGRDHHKFQRWQAQQTMAAHIDQLEELADHDGLSDLTASHLQRESDNDVTLADLLESSQGTSMERHQ